MAAHQNLSRLCFDSAAGCALAAGYEQVILTNGVVIGDNVIIEEFVSIKEDVVIGNNCIIRSGSVIGGQGYEFKRYGKNNILTVEHIGKTIVNDFVEIKEIGGFGPRIRARFRCRLRPKPAPAGD